LCQSVSKHIKKIIADECLETLCYNLELDIKYDFPVQLIERQSVKNIG